MPLIRSKGSSISCAAQKEDPHLPVLLPTAGSRETGALFHDCEKVYSSHTSSADTAKQRLTNQGKRRLIYCFAASNNRPSPHGRWKMATFWLHSLKSRLNAYCNCISLVHVNLFDFKGSFSSVFYADIYLLIILMLSLLNAEGCLIFLASMSMK